MWDKVDLQNNINSGSNTDRKWKHQTSNNHKTLGCLLYFRMIMSWHITDISKTDIFHLRNIGKFRKYIDQSTCQHAIRSFILPRLDCCNWLLSLLPFTDVILLQRLQNWEARLVFEAVVFKNSFYVSTLSHSEMAQLMLFCIAYYCTEMQNGYY